MVDVLVIVVTQSKELLEMLDTYWNRPLSDGLKLGWICTNGASTNNVPKILNRLLEKGTLLQFGTKMFVTKALEDYTEMGKMVAKNSLNTRISFKYTTMKRLKRSKNI